MNLFSLAIYFLPFLFSFTVVYFIRGKVIAKIIAFLLFTLAILSLYKAFEAGLALKNSEIRFVQDGRGKYEKYTEHEKYITIKELKSIQKSRKITFTLFSILYWLSSFGITLGTFKVLRKHKEDKKKSIPSKVIKIDCNTNQ